MSRQPVLELTVGGTRVMRSQPISQGAGLPASGTAKTPKDDATLMMTAAKRIS